MLVSILAAVAVLYPVGFGAALYNVKHRSNDEGFAFIGALVWPLTTLAILGYTLMERRHRKPTPKLPVAKVRR